MGMTDLSVYRSIDRSIDLSASCISLTVQYFRNLFSAFDIRGLHTVQVCFLRKSDGPFRSTVKGHVTFNCITPSCEVSLERSCQELSNDIQLMDPVTVI
jgi:hypothetical protein